MDPAGPLFTKWPKSLKLDASDAEFVDVIHTDAGIFGYPRQIGHVDFWPNQGISPQPGCEIAAVKKRAPDSVLEPSKNFFVTECSCSQYLTCINIFILTLNNVAHVAWFKFSSQWKSIILLDQDQDNKIVTEVTQIRYKIHSRQLCLNILVVIKQQINQYEYDLLIF